MKKLKIILGLSLIIILIFNLNNKSKYNDRATYIEGIIDKYKFDGSKLSLEVLERKWRLVEWKIRICDDAQQ